MQGEINTAPVANSEVKSQQNKAHTHVVKRAHFEEPVDCVADPGVAAVGK